MYDGEGAGTDTVCMNGALIGHGHPAELGNGASCFSCVFVFTSVRPAAG